MRNFKAFITLNVPQKCSVKYYTNAEMLKISKKIVQSVEYSPRPEILEYQGLQQIFDTLFLKHYHIIITSVFIFLYNF